MENLIKTDEKTGETKKFKRLPLWAVLPLLLISFILAEFFTARNVLTAMSFDPAFASMLSNSNVSFLYYLVFGVVMWGIFELVSFLFFRIMRLNLILRSEYMYFLRLLYIVLNVVLFGIRIIYLAFPPFQFFGETILASLVLFGGFFLYYYILLKAEVVPEESRGAHLRSLSTFYFGFAFLMTVFNIVGMMTL